MTAAETLELVVTAHQRLFGDRDTSVLDTDAFAPDFIEHSPLVADGRTGLKQLVDEAPTLRYRLVRQFVDGDLVALHGRYTGLDDEPLIGFDIYRVADGAIVEHWDGLVPEAPPNASGRTQLDGPVHTDRSVDTETSRRQVADFFQTVLVEQQYDEWATFSNGEGFRQHSPDIADGTEAVVKFLHQLKSEGTPLVYDRTHRRVAQNDFVLTQSEGSIDGVRHAFLELWRVADGKIVELWDAIAEIPADSEAVHPYGLF
ncbi:nuclear transport factor 2 family protein [Pseudoclavibacter sp. CFCC 11306]|uniref:nuclear transport factor 2 family protein n=1 Tax=Pseudoclavibacter sp. CFCC 11306 TaxID=1564493 RepID=UPI001301759B|nr:nuclear transport factor 2 family protein [Pseudoclavibacter sp. CFCC 11306]KAB1659143.1 polyketide cyclase [Pseudoclavibacter sp. CFCC 11306]